MEVETTHSYTPSVPSPRHVTPHHTTDRKIDWMSWEGFQEASKMMTRLAATKLMPSDPAFVEIRKRRTLLRWFVCGCVFCPIMVMCLFSKQNKFFQTRHRYKHMILSTITPPQHTRRSTHHAAAHTAKHTPRNSTQGEAHTMQQHTRLSTHHATAHTAKHTPRNSTAKHTTPP